MPSDVEPANGHYLDRLMRRDSFAALWPLFAKATKPAKEMTESFSALQHLRPLMSNSDPCRVIHVGDGAHARTAALFALKTSAHNISVDPLLNEPLVTRWIRDFGIERLSLRRAAIDDAIDELNRLEPARVFVTFVHAHVNVDAVLRRLHWDAAFTLACCIPGHQLTREHQPYDAGTDRSVLSPHRQYEVLVNPVSTLCSQSQPCPIHAERNAARMKSASRSSCDTRVRPPPATLSACSKGSASC